MEFLRFFFISFILFWLVVASPARAEIQHIVDGQGQLTGATGLIINGASFDVTFVDESFENAFSNTIPLIHDTLNEAVAFGDLLNDNVFLDIASGQFDSTPNRIS